MSKHNTGTIIVALVAIAAIMSLVLFMQNDGPHAALSAEGTCYRNFYYCVEQTTVPVDDCLDVQADCLSAGP